MTGVTHITFEMVTITLINTTSYHFPLVLVYLHTTITTCQKKNEKIYTEEDERGGGENNVN